MGPAPERPLRRPCPQRRLPLGRRQVNPAQPGVEREDGTAIRHRQLKHPAVRPETNGFAGFENVQCAVRPFPARTVHTMPSRPFCMPISCTSQSAASAASPVSRSAADSGSSVASSSTTDQSTLEYSSFGLSLRSSTSSSTAAPSSATASGSVPIPGRFLPVIASRFRSAAIQESAARSWPFLDRHAVTPQRRPAMTGGAQPDQRPRSARRALSSSARAARCGASGRSFARSTATVRW